MKGFSIIVAVDADRGIGKGGSLPWNLSQDMKHFKSITAADYGKGLQNVVIMGRKTWESLPEKFRPLPERANAVITSDKDFLVSQGTRLFQGLDSAIAYYCSEKSGDYGKVFVIGGAKVFTEAIVNSSCESLFLTNIHKSFDCDVFFPLIPDLFVEKRRSKKLKENNIEFQFLELIHKNIFCNNLHS